MSISIELVSKDNQIKAECVDYDEIIDTIVDVFKKYHDGKVLLPDKISQVFNKETQNRINCMPSTLLDEGVCGVKWVSVFPGNPVNFGIPNLSGVIILSSLKDGYPFAIMDGTLITALRTACVGAIAAKLLAKKDSQVYGTIGAGEEAKMHFRFIKHVIPSIRKCYVASQTEENEQAFIDQLKDQYQDVEFIKCCSDYRKASSVADIIVTAVSCQQPLLKADSIKEGAFYCHVGGWEDEYDVPLKADKIVCDNWNALKHRGSPTLARLFEKGKLNDSDIYANLGELLAGSKPARENEQEFIYFNSIGLSFVDVAVAYSFYQKARKAGQTTTWNM